MSEKSTMNRRDVFRTLAGVAAGAGVATTTDVQADTPTEAPKGVSLRLSAEPRGTERWARQGCRLELAGQDISHFTRAVTVQADVDDIVRASVEVLAHDDFEVKLPDVHVHLTVVTVPGFVLIEEPQPDGGKRWHVERDTEERRGTIHVGDRIRFDTALLGQMHEAPDHRSELLKIARVGLESESDGSKSVLLQRVLPESGDA